MMARAYGLYKTTPFKIKIKPRSYGPVVAFSFFKKRPKPIELLPLQT